MHQGKPAPMEHLYTNACIPYFRAQHIYIGIPYRFVENRNRVEKEEALAIYKKLRDTDIPEFAGTEIQIWSETRPTIQNKISALRTN